MDAATVAALVLGLVLRLGLPLAVTGLAMWLLKGLDARWQAEAAAGRSWNPAGPRCWELRGCSPAEREACPAFQQPGWPCWQHFRRPNGDLSEACLRCLVFTNARLPIQALPVRTVRHRERSGA